MMPFNVFRSSLLLILNWVVLGAGCYLAYDAYQSLKRAPVVAIPRQPSVTTEAPAMIDESAQPADADIADTSRDSVLLVPENRNWWRPWGEAVVASVCLLWSLGGRLPISWMMKHDASQSMSRAATTSTTIDRPDRSRLFVQVYENENKPTLLLTHGWSLDASAWQHLIPELQSQYRVVTWDLAGLGKSTGPTNHDLSLEKMADDLNAVLEAVATPDQVILVGHSIGGMIQQTFCRRHPDQLGRKVRGIVFVQTTYTNPLSTNLLAWITKPLEPVIGFLNVCMIPFAPLFWLSNWQSYMNGSLHWSARIESFTGHQTWEQLDHSAFLGAKAWPAVVARGNRAMMRFDEDQTLTDVSVPTLVVSGACDRLTLPEASQHIAARIPGARLFMNAGGHLGHWEFRDQVTREILSFVAGVRESTTASYVRI